jgi:hypothetical protein
MGLKIQSEPVRLNPFKPNFVHPFNPWPDPLPPDIQFFYRFYRIRIGSENLVHPYTNNITSPLNIPPSLIFLILMFVSGVTLTLFVLSMKPKRVTNYNIFQLDSFKNEFWNLKKKHRTQTHCEKVEEASMELRFPSHFVFTILIIALLFALTNGIHHNENHKSTESR